VTASPPLLVLLLLSRTPGPARGFLVPSARPSPPLTRLSATSSSPPADRAAAPSLRRDALQIFAHLVGCTGAACVATAWEDFDCAELKPGVSSLRRRGRLAGTSTLGLAAGSSDRAERYAWDGDARAAKIKNYNEIMEEHRDTSVAQWARLAERGRTDGVPYAGGPAEAADVRALAAAVDAIDRGVVLAGKRDWDLLVPLLASEALKGGLGRAMESLRAGAAAAAKERGEGRAVALAAEASADLAREIGFQWGSCAWRMCGALADVQEALSEVEAQCGLYEPEEATFCLLVARQGIVDVLALVPRNVRAMAGVDRKNAAWWYKERGHWEPGGYTEELPGTLGGNAPAGGSEEDEFRNALSFLKTSGLP